MPLGDVYGQDPVNPGFGVSDALGIAAGASAYDYFMLRGRAFSNIATSGIPQGVFGARRLGRYLANRPATQYYGNAALRATGRFLSGTGQPIGVFQTPKGFMRLQGVATNLGGNYFSEGFHVANRGKLTPAYPMGASTQLGLLPGKMAQAEIEAVRRSIGGLGIRESFTKAGVDKVIAESGIRGYESVSMNAVRMGVRRYAALSAIGKVAGSVLPVVNTILMAKLAIDLASFGGRLAGQLVGGAIRGTVETLRSVRGVEFGGPIEMFQTSEAITERQRAMQAIQAHSLNARSYLGGEARHYADTY